MIRIEVGTGRSGALRILAEGAVLNAGLPDEPMPQTLHALAQALVSLSRGKGSQAIELARARTLWLLEPHGDEVALRWFPRGQPGARGRESRVDLHELGRAVSEALARVPATQRVRKRLLELAPPEEGPAPLSGFQLGADAPPLSLRLGVDSMPALHGTAWGSLVAPGSLELHDSRGRIASLEGPPFLALEALLHWAQRVLTAGRRAEPFPWTRGGTLSATGDDLKLGRHHWPALKRPFIAALGELGSELAAAMVARIPSLARHPALRSIAQDSRALRAAARVSRLPARPDAASPRPMRAKKPGPAVASGSVRKLSFEPVFEVRLPFPARRLQLLGERVLALGDTEAALIALADGAVRWRRRVRAAALGQKLFAVDRHDHLLRLDPTTGEPRWFRDSEGIDPIALLPGATGQVVLAEPDALSGRFTETGLAAWHFRPPMGERVQATVAPDRVFVATAGGQLAALDLATGTPLYRALAPSPFRHAPLLWQDALLLVLEGQPADELLVVDAARGEVRAALPLGIRESQRPVARGPTVATLGRSGEGWTLVLVQPAERTREVVATGLSGGRAPALIATDFGFLLCTDDGRLRLFDSAGALQFSEDEKVGAAVRTLEPIVARKVVLVPSERPGLYDLAGRRRLARLPAIDGLCALAVDEELRVITADDGGRIRAFRLRGHLAVVGPS